MYKLIRRISSSFFPRPDRPWSEDATSNAPQIGRKRRHSSTEPEDDEPTASMSKRHRLGPNEAEQDASRREDGEGMREVTKGVQEVEIEEGKNDVVSQSSDAPAAVAAAAIPLPDSPVLEAQKEMVEIEVKDVPEEESPSEEPVAQKTGDEGEELDVASKEATEDSVLVNGVHVEKEGEEGAVTAPLTEEGVTPALNSSEETIAISVKDADAAPSVAEDIVLDNAQTKTILEKEVAQDR